MDIFFQKFRENLLQIRLNLTENNYLACSKISSSLVRNSFFFENKEAVFISEYFDYLFYNIVNEERYYGISDEEKEIISYKVVELIDYLTKDIPIDNDVEKIRLLYDLMVDTRYDITKIQLFHEKNKTPKFRKFSGPPGEFFLDEQ